jgi:glucosamine-6-phosphate deaminase
MKLIISKTKEELGKLSAKHAEKCINEAIKNQGYARILLSTGASQFPFFDEFVKCDIDWSKVEMFHLDEYVGITDEHPASFKRYLTDRFVNLVKPGKAHLIEGSKNPEETIKELTALINEKPIDVGLIGIGENAHLAFNDPPVADFNDQAIIKPVKLDEICRQQQVNDKTFDTLDEVPRYAVTLTIPTMVSAKYMFCVVPTEKKAQAVYNTMNAEISEAVPATAMRNHKNAIMYTDKDSAALLK